MAFVYRSEKNAAQRSQTSQLIGPGAYVTHQQYNIPRAFVPFNSKEDRGNKRNKDKETQPGPGAYEINRENGSEKVVVSSANDDIKIVEVPKPQSNFKSQTKRQSIHDLVESIYNISMYGYIAARFTDKSKVNAEAVPGPGQYDAFEPFKEIVEKGQAHNQMVEKQTIIDRLMKMNRYQSNPSIPSKAHTYGYTENESNDLALNKIPVKQHTGLLRDSVGPGQYELKDCFEIAREKGAAWHKYKEARLKDQFSKTSLQVGPGTYDVQAQTLPLYKMKQSSGFASRSVRSIEGKRGTVATQFVKQAIANRNAAQNLLEDEESDEEFIENAVPGPGHYFTEKDRSTFKRISKSNSHGNFGSLQKRFSSGPMFGNPIGPGEYNPIVSGVIGKNPSEVKKRNPPFLSSDTRFLIKKIEDFKPGPGAYEPRINLEDKLIAKIQKGYRGNFGSTERRFKNDALIEELPGPGAYIETIPIPNEDDEPMPQTSVFKSVSQRAIFKGGKDQRPPVGSYKLDYYDIEKKVNQEPEDPDLKIKVPNLGFNTSEQRFKMVEIKRGELEEDEDELNVIKEKRKEEDRFVKENKNFNTKAERFNYKSKSNVPAPGHYHDTNSAQWKKRTFNILFADF